LSLSQAMSDSVRTLAYCSLPSLSGALGGAVVGTVMQAGLQFNVEPLEPKLERLNFIDGCKKLFSMRQVLEVAKGMAVALCVGVLSWNFLHEHINDAFRALNLEGGMALRALAEW
jgi:flagellar biosynthesis protein FlhB